MTTTKNKTNLQNLADLMVAEFDARKRAEHATRHATLRSAKQRQAVAREVGGALKLAVGAGLVGVLVAVVIVLL